LRDFQKIRGPSQTLGVSRSILSIASILKGKAVFVNHFLL
jgi:hypothetical protein